MVQALNVGEGWEQGVMLSAVLLTKHGGNMLDVVEAEVYGLLAVHPAYEGEGYTVTHIPTGCALKSCKHLDRELARHVASTLSKLDGWNTVDKEWLVKFMQPKIREIVKNYGWELDWGYGRKR
jgi:hypothetical protein